MNHRIFDAHLRALPEMLAFIQGAIPSQKAQPALIQKILIAAEEALVNVIHYGYSNDLKGTLEIRCEEILSPEGIKIIIHDRGLPFDPTSRPSAVLPKSIEESRVGGLGIYIFLGIMDHVEYARKEDGNLLTLTKYF